MKGCVEEILLKICNRRGILGSWIVSNLKKENLQLMAVDCKGKQNPNREKE